MVTMQMHSMLPACVIKDAQDSHLSSVQLCQKMIIPAHLAIKSPEFLVIYCQVAQGPLLTFKHRRAEIAHRPALHMNLHNPGLAGVRKAVPRFSGYPVKRRAVCCLRAKTGSPKTRAGGHLKQAGQNRTISDQNICSLRRAKAKRFNLKRAAWCPIKGDNLHWMTICQLKRQHTGIRRVH